MVHKARKKRKTRVSIVLLFIRNMTVVEQKKTPQPHLSLYSSALGELGEKMSDVSLNERVCLGRTGLAIEAATVVEAEVEAAVVAAAAALSAAADAASCGAGAEAANAKSVAARRCERAGTAKLKSPPLFCAPPRTGDASGLRRDANSAFIGVLMCHGVFEI